MLNLIGVLIFILLGGLLLERLAIRSKLPVLPFWILLGLSLSFSPLNQLLVPFNSSFIALLALLTTAFTLFESGVFLRRKSADGFSRSATKVVFFSLALHIFILAPVLVFFFDIPFVHALLFALVVLALAPQKALFVKQESIKAALIAILSVSFLLDLADGFALIPVWLLSIAIGMFLALLTARFHAKQHALGWAECGAILAFLLASFLNANNLVAVAAYAIALANLVSEKPARSLARPSNIHHLLFLLTVVLASATAPFPSGLMFYLQILAIFMVYLLLRLIAIRSLASRERLKTVLSCAKGVPIFTISLLLFFQTPLHAAAVVFALYSAITAYGASKL